MLDSIENWRVSLIRLGVSLERVGARLQRGLVLGIKINAYIIAVITISSLIIAPFNSYLVQLITFVGLLMVMYVQGYFSKGYFSRFFSRHRFNSIL